MNNLLDTLALPFFALLLAHFRTVLGAAGNGFRANIRHWTNVFQITLQFALGAALKPALCIFMGVFVALVGAGVGSMHIAGVGVPAAWWNAIGWTVVIVIVVSAALLGWIWGNRTLPMAEIEAIEILLRTTTPATLEGVAAQESERLTREFGGRAPVVFFFLFAGCSLLAIGLELILLSAWVFRWQNDLPWAASVWTAFVGSIAMYMGARSLKAPFVLASVIAIQADKPLDWGVRFLADSGLLILPGITGANLGNRNAGLNVPLELVGAALGSFGNGAMSALRYFIAVTLIALNIVCMAGAAIIGFFVGIAATEQQEVGRIDTHPQVQRTTKWFWGEVGVFLVGIVVRVVWMLLSTPLHAATAPTGPDTTVVQHVMHVASNPAAPTPGTVVSWWHALTAMNVWAACALLIICVLPFLGFLDAVSGKFKSLGGKVVGMVLGVPATFVVLGVLCGWVQGLVAFHPH